jgi:tetratricopeptide (TPR) repeat protein
MQGDYPRPAALADNLARGGEASAQPIVRALERAAKDAQRERHTERPLQPALVLLIDQLEELFAQGVRDNQRAAFAESLAQLVASGRVWCIGTLRADLYELMLKQPVLKALKEAGASFDLGPPGPAELADIVRAPAEAAGLAFEHDPVKGDLDERLLADARSADSLPLLQFTLQQLYRQRVDADGQTRLTHAAYDALGGLRGAIAAEAEQAVSSLSPDAIAALPRLLRHLAEPARDANTLTLREVLRADAAVDAAETALLDALVAARILIAGTDAQGRATVRLAHDAVFASWSRAAEAAQANRDFYRVRADVEDALRRWQAHNRPKDRLIQQGIPLAEAEDLVARFGRELSAELAAYVTASRNRARRRQQLVAAAAAVFFVLAVASTAAGGLAYRAQQEALRAEQRAVTERDKATRNFRLAQRTAESIVFDIAQGLRDVEGMRAEAVRKILETAKATFDQLAAAAPDDINLQRGVETMLIEFGDTYGTLGSLDEALKSFRDGLAIAEGLANAEPNNADWQRDLSVLNERLGDVYLTQGKLAPALEQYRASLGRMIPLRERDPSNVDLQRFTSVTLNKVGDVSVAQGNLAEALKAFRDSLAIAERLARSEPDNAERLRDLSVVNERLGDVYLAEGNLDAALEQYRTSLARMVPLRDRDPSNVDLRRFTSVTLNKIGVVLESQAKLDEALESFHGSLAIRERLVKADPDNARWLRDLSVSYDRIGDVLLAQGKLDEALKSFRDGLIIAERLVGSDPKNAGWQRDVAVGHAKLAELFRRLGKVAEALAELRQGRAIMATLVEMAPGYAQWKKNLAWFDGQIAELDGQAQEAGK